MNSEEITVIHLGTPPRSKDIVVDLTMEHVHGHLRTQDYIIHIRASGNAQSSNTQLATQ